MSNKILYLGDTNLKAQAAYLAGIMNHYGIDFDYLPSDENFKDTLLNEKYSAIILSDYPSSNFTKDQLEKLIFKIKDGTGLLMIGGWESFTGNSGGYNNTVFKQALPVIMQDDDDRMNCSNPCIIDKNCEHEIINNLPFENNAPVIGGFNNLKAKESGKVILSVRKYNVCKQNGEFSFSFSDSAPLLITGQFGTARTAAFTSDVAPHWVGGFVDWGNQRITGRAEGAEQIEVGNRYAEFFRNLILWVSQIQNR
jgi:uncharacterized membrane protein